MIIEQKPSDIVDLKPFWFRYKREAKLLDKRLRCSMRLARAKKSQNITYDIICKKYSTIPSYAEVMQLKNELLPKQERILLSLPVFQYWHQGSSLEKAVKNGSNWSPVHKMSFLSVDRYYKENHIVLDFDTIHDYINFCPKLRCIVEKFIQNKRIAGLSDLFRTILLFLYGGIWCDFTIFLLNKIPQDILKEDVFFYVRGKKPADYKEFEIYDPAYFCWDDDYKVRVLSSFIFAKKENYFLGALTYKLFEILEKENLSELDYFMYQIVFDYLVRTTEFFPIYNKMASFPSDAKCHILHRNAANKFSENIYKEIKYKYPIQKLNANLPFIKNCLLYETILREKF
ncbi:capsular polysaccharide synthesis protein [Succinatimonas hippei]|uniref:capsular polysaccharide synthesis protein n=1 Tax=Succinatimonas hippei TaxID=626938 RepID=UPI0023F99C54|nr:capsular polysaccharide synthesis protein [Succinatimonas hippei]